MPVFVLKKYEPNAQDTQEKEAQQEQTNTEQNINAENKPNKQDKQIFINATKSVSEVIYDTVMAVYAKENIEEAKDITDAKASIVAMSDKDIDLSPKQALDLAKDADVVYIKTEGFKTIAHENFLSELYKQNKKVLFTEASLKKEIESLKS